MANLKNGRNGGHAIPRAAPPAEAIRRMDHRQWLMQAAVAFETQWKQNQVEMTPFRLGMITRLKLAAEYIALIENDVARATAEFNRATAQLDEAGKKIEALIRDLEKMSDKAFGNPHHGHPPEDDNGR